MRSKAFKGVVLTVVLAATVLLFLSAVQVPVKATLGGVEINEIYANAPGGAPEAWGEWVEIINTGAGSADVTNWWLTDDETNWTIVDSTVLNQWDCYVFNMSENASGGTPALSNSGEELRLYDDTDALIDTVKYVKLYDDETFNQIYDGEYDLWDSDDTTPSKGLSNQVHSGSLKINEVFYAGGTDFVELYNTGASPEGNTNWVLRHRYLKSNLAGPVPAGEHCVYVEGDNLTWYINENYAGWVVLENENGQTVDRMCFANDGYTTIFKDESGASASFPYTCPDVMDGHSLERKPGSVKDTDKDSDDFQELHFPTPGTFGWEPAPPVGGILLPNIFKLLVIGASVAAIAVVATAIVIKRRRH